MIAPNIKHCFFKAILLPGLLATIFLAPTQLCAQVTWVNPGDGNWQDGANWSTGSVPGVADDVEIDQGGGNLVTIGASISGINSLISQENLLLTENNNLVLANGGTINGSFTHGINSDLTVNGGVFTANGTTVLDGGNVFADGGSVVNLATVSSYLTDTGTNISRTFRASDSSTLNLSGINSLTGGGFIRTLNVQALEGSTINLSNLTNYVGGTTRFLADGSGSVVDIDSLTTFQNDQLVFAQLQSRNGGTINASALTTISATNGGENQLIIDGATSSINAGNLTDIVNTNVQFTNGGSTDLSGISTFTGSSAIADSGVTIDLSGVTSYDTNGGGNFDREFSADGATIDLSNVATLTGGGFIRSLNVNAANGGIVDLSELADIDSGAVNFIADGAGSLVDISSLQNFNNDNDNVTSLIRATNGGEVRLDSNPASNLNFNNVDVTLDVGGTIDTSRITNYTNGVFTSNGVDRVLALTDAATSSFIANAGANLDVSSLTGDLENQGINFSELNLEANGFGSSLDISNVNSLGFNATSINPEINVRATDGGFVDASSVATISGAGGIINSSRAINVLADGAGSVVDLSSLTTYSDTSSIANSQISILNDGFVDFGSNDTALTNIGLSVDSGGSITANSLELISLETNSSGETQQDIATLFGNGGTVNADVINTSGLVLPGFSLSRFSAGVLTIDGDFTQGIDGTTVIQIDSATSSSLLDVSGDANLDGTLDLFFNEGFGLGADQEFLIIDIDGTRNGVFTGLSQGSVVTSDNGFDLRIDYRGGDGNDVVLTTGFVGVPEPGSTGIMMAATIALLVRRRKRD